MPKAVLATSLRDALEVRASSRETWLILPEDPVRSDAATRLSFEEVFREASAIARGFCVAGAEPGTLVGMVAGNSLEFIATFFGAVLAGLVPAPLHLPYFVPSWETYVSRIRTVLIESSAGLFVTTDDQQSLIAGLRDLPMPSLSYTTLLNAGSNSRLEALPRTKPHEEDVAVVQYSSGSTRAPRGIELTHQAVIWNIHAIGREVGAHPGADVALCWLPLFHDMGLFGTMVYSWYWGLPLVLMTPQDFIGRPASWLWAIHRFGVTGCAAPNFAYALCASREKVSERSLAGLDLSKWRIAFNGAEAVKESTIEAFTARFAAYGFERKAMYPVYGLAENVVGAVFPPHGREARIDRVARRPLEHAGRAVPAISGAPETRGIVSVGRALSGMGVRVTRRDGTVADQREVGEVEISGRSLMKGYRGGSKHDHPVRYEDGWLRTGDLGYLADEELFVVGRSKETIKRGGASLDASDLQAVVSDIPGIRAGCVAAFGMEADREGTEHVVIVAETRLVVEDALQKLNERIRRAIAEVFAIEPDVVVLVEPGSLPKTSSGKVRSLEARTAFSRGEARVLSQWSRKSSHDRNEFRERLGGRAGD